MITEGALITRGDTGGRISQCVVLPTKDRVDLLLGRSLPSVANQSVQPDFVLIVNDGEVFDDWTTDQIHRQLPGTSFEIITNHRTKGLSGSINSACVWLTSNGYQGFVALLDDDDNWEPDHLESNLGQAKKCGADLVISGLRMVRDDEVLSRELLTEIDADSFLAGNPGWQGSNTYVRFETLLEAGGFREGLQSCNDRDLAIRLLDFPNVRVGYTNKWTANWRQDKSRQTLSTNGSDAKLSGLAAFFQIYHGRMSASQERHFFDRSERYFGFSESLIRARSLQSIHLQLLHESES